MANINRVTMSGNLTRDAICKTIPSGNKVLEFRLASNLYVGGEKGVVPNYFDCEIWGNRAEKLVQYFTKGRGICIDGSLRYSEWEKKDKTKGKKITIHVDNFDFKSSLSSFSPSSEKEDDIEMNNDNIVPFDEEDDSDIPFDL